MKEEALCKGMAGSTEPGQTWTVLFECSKHGIMAISKVLIDRSQFLKDLVEVSVADTAIDHVPVPVGVWRAMHLWTDHFSKHVSDAIHQTEQDHSVSAQPQDGPSTVHMSMHEACELLSTWCVFGAASALLILNIPIFLVVTAESVLDKVADVLIDEALMQQCATHIAQILQVDESNEQAPTPQDAMPHLPEHLHPTVLCHVPLPHCLSHLPLGWHAAALRAHNHSVDSHGSLCMPRLPIDTVTAALQATATLSHLEALSLAGLTIPDPHSLTTLTCLSALTTLNVKDIGLREASATALAALLPCLPRLHNLNLSRNALTTSVMRTLAPSMKQCTGLQALDMMGSLGIDEWSDCGVVGLDAAAGLFCDLACLTRLAMGVHEWSEDTYMPRHREEYEMFSAALHNLPSLLSLTVHLVSDTFRSCWNGCESQAKKLFGALLELTQLEHLNVALPYMHAQSHPTAGLAASLTRLTCLAVKCVGFVDAYRSQEVHVMPDMIPQLPLAPCLRDLSLSLPTHASERISSAYDTCDALAAVLPGMTALSCLELGVGAAFRNFSPRLQERYAVSLLGVLRAVMQRPQIAVLKVSAHVHAGDALGQLVAALQGVRTRLSLTLDLYCMWSRSFPLLEQGPLDVLSEFIPLFPVVKHLVVNVNHMHPRGQLLSLQPLLHAGMSALQQLQGLTLRAFYAQQSCVAELLSSVSHLGSLTKLDLCLPQSRLDQTLPERERGVHRRAFLQGLLSLHELKRLVLRGNRFFHDNVNLVEVIKACVGLTGLEALRLNCSPYVQQYGGLSSLRVKEFTLHAWDYYCEECFDKVAEQVSQLRDLRLLNVVLVELEDRHNKEETGILDHRTPFEEATDKLPAFQVLDFNLD